MKPDLVETSPGSNVFFGTGNVFFDLGFADAPELTTKVRFAVAINKILDERKLTQKAAAKVLDINQPKVSALRNYRLEGFSVSRLMEFVTALDYDVLIELRPRADTCGAAKVAVAVAA
jgi:predicted XRE-type DNA-binding protein